MGIQKIIFLLSKECGRVCQRVVTVIARMKVIYQDSISFKEKWNCDRTRLALRNRKNTCGLVVCMMQGRGPTPHGREVARKWGREAPDKHKKQKGFASFGECSMEKLGHGISRKMMDQRKGIQIYGGQALGRMEPSILCCDPVGMVMSQGETALRLQEKCQGKF